MEEQELISKKDLLQETGISYGQLYRWKREKLIPEEWFIKKSSFTGQETFFPRARILQRIKDIVEWKDRYSLGELVQMVSPEQGMQSFDSADALRLNLAGTETLEIFERELKKNHFQFLELLFIMLTERAVAALKKPDPERTAALARCAANWVPGLKNTAWRFSLCETAGAEHFYLLSRQDNQVFFDPAARELLSIDLDTLAAELKTRLKENENA